MNLGLEMDDLDARLFVNGVSDQEDLVAAVAQAIGGERDEGVVRTSRVEVVVDHNKQSDHGRAVDWPDGFLFFRWILGVHFPSDAAESERAEIVSALLRALWSRPAAAVAACRYESLLPSAGGTADRSLPWPQPTD